jgi:hypothetical protein
LGDTVFAESGISFLVKAAFFWVGHLGATVFRKSGSTQGADPEEGGFDQKRDFLFRKSGITQGPDTGFAANP